MKLHLSLVLLFVGLFGSWSVLIAQNVDYTVTITELMAEGDNNDGGGFAGSQDPYWQVWLKDNTQGAFTGSGCYETTNGYGVWTTSFDVGTVPNTLISGTNSAATVINSEMEGWENDTGGDCSFDTSLFNDDDNHDGRGPSGDITFQSQAPCQDNTYTINVGGDYYARIDINWNYSNPTGGTITGDQSVCNGGDPAVLGNSVDGIAASSTWYSYQWQIDAGCTGSFTDITGATSATYDPPAGLTQTSCYRRVSRCATCADEVSNTVTVTISTNSTDGSSITATPAVLCGAGTVDLTLNGGTLGTGADWYWYEGDPSAGGTLITSGVTSITGHPLATTTDIWVRAESPCHTSTGISQTVTVGTPSTDPTSVTSTATTICEGSTIDLTVNGGSLGTGANWVWYDTDPTVGSPAAIFSSTSSSYNGAAPTTNTTYYVRAEGCNTTAAVSIGIVVESLSSDPTSITASATTICAGGGPVTLDVVGGSLGTGANWEWYDAGCGSNNVGSGPQLIVSPTVTTTYYSRAEGTCNNSNCASVTITVDQLSTDPVSISVANTNLCPGQTAVLTVSGGSLGTGADWQWYDAGCGSGTNVGSGNTISVTPGATTTYFVRAEGTCNTTACASETINIGTGAADPDSATVSMNNICPEDTVTLTAWSSSALPTGYTYVWYTGACGAVPVGVGQTLDVAPSATETYYVRAVGTCGESLCAEVTVTVLPGSITPNGITSDDNNFCLGGSATLTVDGGSLEAGAVWTWYENSCGGGTAIGTGSSITVTPNTPTAYFVRGEGGACGNTECVSININVLGSEVYLVPFDTVCVEGNTAFNLTGGLPSGGAYSGTAVSGGVFDASAAGVGNHTITYTYTDGFGCSNTATEDITVVEANVAATSVTADNSVVCSSGSATLTVNGGTLVTGADWYWYENACGGGTSIGNGTSITVSPTQTTTYFVRAEGGNDYCGPTECVAITISVSNPEANLLPFDDVCGTNTVTLSEGIPSGGTYSGTGVTSGVFDAAVAGVGTHTITYTYTDGNGCSATATGDITVVGGSINLETAIETQTCANGGVLVHAIATGGNGFYIYSWSDGSTDNPHMWTDPGTYTVTVTDGTGCSASVDSIEVTDDLACLELANTFTPNADGTNDTWNLDFSAYSSANLEVYSKWGVLVYQTDGLTIQWDGNDMNGNALPAGTYYYIVNLDGGSKTQNGPISIVR